MMPPNPMIGPDSSFFSFRVIAGHRQHEARRRLHQAEYPKKRDWREPACTLPPMSSEHGRTGWHTIGQIKVRGDKAVEQMRL